MIVCVCACASTANVCKYSGGIGIVVVFELYLTKTAHKT